MTDIIEKLRDIFENLAADSYIGEDVTISEHMLQVAGAAEAEGADPALVAACLLHDVGHYVGKNAEEAHNAGIDLAHERLGADLIAPHFPDAVSEPVRLHVPAKRYLCAVEGGYFDVLSEASKHSLKLQGGPMSDDEVRDFESNPHHHAAVRLRRWEDGQGKVVGRETKPFQHYVPLLQSLLK